MLKVFQVICRSSDNKKPYSINYLIDIKADKNIEKAIQAALCEYAETEDEDIVFEDSPTLTFFNLQFVPREICEKHGFHIVNFDFNNCCVYNRDVVLRKNINTKEKKQ